MRLKIGTFATLLQVFDMPSSLRFYRDVLGFEVVGDVPPDDQCDWVMLALNGSELMLNSAHESKDRPPTPDPMRIAAHGDVTLYFDYDAVDSAHAYLREHNVAAKEPTVAFYGMKQVYVKDPDGYQICLQHPVSDPVDSELEAREASGRMPTEAAMKRGDKDTTLLARFNSTFSRSSCFRRVRSSVVSPARWPPSRSACRTQRRNDSTRMPNFSATDRIAAQRLWNPVGPTKARTSPNSELSMIPR